MDNATARLYKTFYLMTKYLFTLLILLRFNQIAASQKAPLVFGEISKADLINNIYTSDTTAPAVVLCDYGYYSDVKRQTVRILRIKILKKEGYPWANYTFPTDSKTDIKGITYNLEHNEIIESTLKNESIFKTRITEDSYEVRVAMPNVKVGSIIDIQFVFDGIPRTWDFQQEIPVMHSELVIEPSSFIMYHKNFYGYIPLTVNTGDRWVSENVPAFKPEEYIPSTDNLRSRFEFDVEFIIFREYTQYLTTTWDAVRDVLYKSFYFGAVLDNDGYLRSVAKDIEKQCSTREEMIKMAYAYAKKIKWDQTNSFLTDKKTLSMAFKDGKGNSAEVNLALLQILLRLGFNAAPVVLSTRSHGRLSLLHPSIYKLNYVIAAVFTNTDTLLLDATETNCPYNLLPWRTLNGQGQILNKSSTGWIELQSHKKDKVMVVYSLTFNDAQNLKGKLSYSRGDYAALNFRNNYSEFNSDEEYLTDFKEGKKGLKIVSHKIDNLDSLYQPVSEDFEIEISNAVTSAEDELYLIPLLFDQMKENLFKLSERKYPIDLGYGRDKTVIVNYTFPNEYKIIELPANQYLKLHGNSATFICQSTLAEGEVSIMYKLNINKSEFTPSEYADLREFYNQILAKEAEPIVLKKK
jgi:hypothetical protein